MGTNETLNNDYRQYEKQYLNNSKGMFTTFLTWNGRIRRREYIVYFVVCSIIASIARIMHDDSQWWFWWFIEMVAYLILTIEAIKRSHDTGSSGWYILIPFYGLILLFENSEKGINKYGSNPKRPYGEQIDEILMQNEEEGSSEENMNENKPAISDDPLDNTSNASSSVADTFDYKQDSPSLKVEETSKPQFVADTPTTNKEPIKDTKTSSSKTTLYTIIIVILIFIIGILVLVLFSNRNSSRSTVDNDHAISEVTQATSESSVVESKPDPREEELANFNSQMEEQARVENEEAGKFVANGIKITNVQYDKTKRVITYNYEVSNLVVAGLPNYSKSEHKKDILNELKADGGWKAAMKDYGLKVKYIYFNKKGEIVRSIELSSSDL